MGHHSSLLNGLLFQTCIHQLQLELQSLHQLLWYQHWSPHWKKWVQRNPLCHHLKKHHLLSCHLIMGHLIKKKERLAGEEW